MNVWVFSVRCSLSFSFFAAGSDFIQVGPVLLTFDRSMDAMELVVPIINDGIAEGIEDFNGILSTTETSVILNPSLTTISIADNDSKVWFISWKYVNIYYSYSYCHWI